MSSKIILTICVLVAVAATVSAQAAQAGPAAAPWVAPVGIPPWVAASPWFPKWQACTTIGSSCKDCTTKSVCTKIGGLERPCTDPLKPYCNLGECSATPAAGCAPAVPAATAA